jgi:hypothetical protein
MGVSTGPMESVGLGTFLKYLTTFSVARTCIIGRKTAATCSTAWISTARTMAAKAASTAKAVKTGTILSFAYARPVDGGRIAVGDTPVGPGIERGS